MPKSYPHSSSPAVSNAMKGNRRVDTKPEVALRSALHRRGHRFFKNRQVRAGQRSVRPDIIFAGSRVAVFVDGCFWHSCPEHGTQPGGPNASYWERKLTRNSERDLEDTKALTSAGWSVVRVWEHEQVREAVLLVERALMRG